MSTLQRGVLLTAVAAMLAGALAGCNTPSTSSSSTSGSSSSSSTSTSAGGDVVATVNDTPITKDDFYQQLQTYRPQPTSMMGGVDSNPAGIEVLRSMIETQLIEQLAKKDGVYPTQAQIDQGYQDLQLQSDRRSVKPLDEQLQTDGLTPDNVKQNQIVPQLCQLLEGSKGVTVTDADIKAYYDLHKTDEFTLPAGAHIKRIQCSNKADAAALLDKLNKGGSWDDAYNSPQSTDKSIEGGDVNQWIDLSITNPNAKPLLDAIKSTPAGKFAGPIQLGPNYWVIQVVETRPSSTYTIDKVQNLIKDQILSQKGMNDPSKSSEFASAMRDEATSAKIVVNLPQYQQLVQQITHPQPTPAMAPPPGPGGPPSAPPAPGPKQ